jgi:hypothetical protein
MARAVVARRDGDAFQARVFWQKALNLLDQESAISRVGFESGPKGFDDIWVEYDDRRCPRDEYGNALGREHLQTKWHVSPGTYGYADLVDPSFINATSRSFLERARDAQRAHAPTGVGARFKLVTNWQILQDDALRPLVSQRSGALRLEQLFDGSTDRSQTGQIRRRWREHLDVDDAELRILAQVLAFASAAELLDGMREDLDRHFARVGLKRIPLNESAWVYDDVVYQWAAQGRSAFDRATFREACAEENLLGSTGTGGPLTCGVKSFEHAFDRLEDRCRRVLDLVPAFQSRYIRNPEDWKGDLYPKLEVFLRDAAVSADRLRLALDAHATLAFAAGAVLNLKSGRVVEVEQRTIGRRVWSPDDEPEDAAWPRLVFEVKVIPFGGADVAVAIGVTHDVAAAVSEYVRLACPSVGRVLIARLSSGAGNRSIVCGRHAFDLAETLAARIMKERGHARAVHLFSAAPNAFVFFLGQRQLSIGPVTLYEFDFERGRHATYESALSIPV